MAETAATIYPPTKAGQPQPALEQVLCDAYASEVNVSIQGFWNVGWVVRLGDAVTGYDAEEKFAAGSFELIAPWLVVSICWLYPDTPFAKQYRKRFG